MPFKSKLTHGLLFLITPLTWATDLELDVSGYNDSGFIYGTVDGNADSMDVEGYLTTEESNELYFEGERVGDSEIEGVDENGNYIELSID